MVAIYPYLFVRILPFWHQCAKFNVSKSKKSCMCSPFLQKCIWLSSHLVPGHGAPVRYSLSSGFQDIRSFIKAYQRLSYLQKCQQEHQNVSSSNPLLLCYPMTFLHTILKRIKMKSNRISNVVPFLLVMVFHQDCPLLTVFLSIKTSSQSISLTRYTRPHAHTHAHTLKLYEYWGSYLLNTVPWTILEKGSQCREMRLREK